MYYDPEKYGLEIVAKLEDPHASYSFDIFCVWIRKADGELFYGQDSGCSCPSPFEKITGVEMLSRLGDLKSFERELIDWGIRYFHMQELDEVLDQVKVAKLYKTTMLL
jgi:hypothetical protein